jgi:hypothetical protein
MEAGKPPDQLRWRCFGKEDRTNTEASKKNQMAPQVSQVSTTKVVDEIQQAVGLKRVIITLQQIS